jgi:hypothetical protein
MSLPVPDFELTGSVCNSEKAREYMRYCVPSHSVSKEHTPSCGGVWRCILTKSKWYRCPLQPTSSGDVSSVGTCRFLQRFPATFVWLWFSGEVRATSMGSWPNRTRNSRPQKIHTVPWRSYSILPNAVCCIQSAGKGLLDRSLWRAP